MSKNTSRPTFASSSSQNDWDDIRDDDRDQERGRGHGREIHGTRGNDVLSGSAGSDRLSGGPGDDRLDGGSGNDRLKGGKGNDRLTGGAGDDRIDGGAGFDTAHYSGNFADYEIRMEGSGRGESRFRITIIDLRDGSPEGTDHLRRIEALHFADRTIALDGSNQSPTAGNDLAALSEDTTITLPAATLLANDGDPDGDPIRIVSVASGNGASVLLDAAGDVVVTPLAHFSGQASFSYTIADSSGATATGTVILSVSAVADVPSLSAADAAGFEDSAIPLDIAAGLVDTDLSEILEIVLSDLPAGTTLSAGERQENGSWKLSAGQLSGLSLTPPPDFHGAIAVTVTATATELSNLDSAASTTAFRVTIASVNDAPAIPDGPSTGAVTEGSPVATGQLVASDDSGAPVTWSLGGGDGGDGGGGGGGGGGGAGNLGGIVVTPDGAWTYTLDGDAPTYQALPEGETATETFIVLATDGEGASSSTIIEVTVTGRNDAPVAAPDNNAGDAVEEEGVNPANTPYPGDPLAAGNVLANDSDVDHGARLMVANPGLYVGAYGTLTLGADGAWSYALDNADPDTDALAQDERAGERFSYTVTDEHGAIDTEILSLSLSGTNDAPVITAQSGPAGLLDPTFGGDGTAGTDFGMDREDATALALQADGKVVVAGWTVVGPLDFAWAVARYSPDGSLDGSFGSGGKVVSTVGGPLEQATSIVIQDDGRIVVAGDDYKKAAFVRYQADGSLDTSFGAGGTLALETGPDSRVERLALQPDGKIVGVGRAWGGFDWDFAAWRVNADGTLDGRFGGGGALRFEFGTGNSEAYGVAVQPDGKVLVGGFSANGADTDFTLARLNPDGTLDAAFGAGGVARTAIGTGRDEAFGIALQPDGKVVVAGWSDNGTDMDYALVRYSADGSVDATFGNGGMVTHPVIGGANYDVVFDVLVQPDGKIVAAGESASHVSLARYYPDGSLDASFDDDGKVLFSMGTGGSGARGVALQADGNIVVAGTDYSEAGDFAVARLTGGGFTATVREDVTLSAGGRLTATDVDHDAILTWSIDGGGAGAFGMLALIGNDGTWTYTLDNGAAHVQALAEGEQRTETFTVRVTDEHGATDTEILSLSLAGTNDAPVASPDSNGADPIVEEGVNPANTPYPGDPLAAGNVLANDSDPDAGDTKAVIGVAAGASGGLLAGNVGVAVAGQYGTLTLGAGGNWSYALDNADADTDALAQGEIATEVFSYTMTDAHGLASTATLAVEITGTNDAPVAEAQTLTTDEDLAVGGVLAASDVDSPDLVFSLSGPAFGGAVTDFDAASGSFTFTPAVDFSGIAWFEFSASDGSAGSSQQTVTVDVAPVADVPTLVIDTTASATGGEFRVNTTTAGPQQYAAVATLRDGSFVVCWEQEITAGDPGGIFAQRYDSTGARLGSEFRVNATVVGDQTPPVIAPLADGGFLVAWDTYRPELADIDVWARRFDASGAPVSDDFRVNTTTSHYQQVMSAIGFADGSFAVGWVHGTTSANAPGFGYEAYAQRYGADGQALGGEFLINAFQTNDQTSLSMDVLSGGGFVTTWTSRYQDGSGYGVYGRIFDAQGVAGSEFRVNSTVPGDQMNPDVAVLGDGGFAIAWNSVGQDGSGYGVYAQRYTADGVAIGGELAINTQTVNDQRHPSILALPDGGFLVAWDSYGQDGSDLGVLARRFDASGNALSGEFRVNVSTAGEQSQYVGQNGRGLDVLADGTVVAVWHGAPSVSGREVYGRLIDLDSTGIDSGIPIGTIRAEASDTDGSETLVLELSGFPAGATFSKGALAGGEWLITDAGDIASLASEPLTMVPPAGWTGTFTLVVEALVTDSATLSSGAATHSTSAVRELSVTVPAQNEPPPAQVNHPPVVGGTSTGSVQEDVTLSASGQLVALDPDLGAQLTWSVAGGNAPHVADYRVLIDNFRVVKNGVLAFNDAFDDGNPPPSAPNFSNGSPASYSAANLAGVLTESGGRAVMDGSLGVPFAIGTGTGHFTTLITDTSSNLAPGFKIDDNLTVEGLFDLFVPDDRGEGYGIRLTDHVSGHTGDDAIQLAVLRGADGVLRVGLSELDFVADTVTALGGSLFNPAPQADQVLLRLTHAANSGIVTGSLDLLAGGVVVSSMAVPGSGRIFGTETPGDASDDEVWTRAQFVATSSAFVDSGVNGVYGTLTVDQAGRWSYQLANGQANVQALAQGETVTDSFTISVTDEHGAASTQSVTIDVRGTNDAPHALLGQLPCLLPENLAAGTVIGQLTGADWDATDVLSYSLADSAEGRFAIDAEGRVSVTRPFDFESEAGPFSITARVSDPFERFFDRTFAIGLANLDEPPTDIALVYFHPDPAVFPENMQNGAVIGHLWAFDPEPLDQFTFSLVDDFGGRFKIIDNMLVVNGPLPALEWNTPFPSILELSRPAPTPQVTVRVSDSVSLSFDESFEVPLFPRFGPSVFDIGVSEPWVSELTGAGNPVFAVGLAASPPGIIPTLSLTGNAGGRFSFDGTHVIQNQQFDYETAPVLSDGSRGYTVTLHAGWGIYGVSESFDVKILDKDENPYPIQLGSDWVLENAPPAFVGGLSLHPAIDPGSWVTFSLSEDAGGAFHLIGNALYSTRSFDFNAESFFQVRVHAQTESGETPEALLGIWVADMNEAPTDIFLFNDSVSENAFPGSFVTTVGVVDPDWDDTHDADWRLTLLGGAENGPFYLLGRDLYVKGPLDFETQSYYDLTISAVDAKGLGYGKTVRINVTDQPGIEYFAPDGGGVFHGGFEADVLVGGVGADLFDGFGGNDVLRGGLGRDILRGGMGDDVLDGGIWFDGLTPQSFDDLDYASYSSAPGGIAANLALGTVYVNAFGGMDTISFIEGLIGSPYDDTLVGGANDVIEVFRGGGGDDWIDGGAGLDRAEYVDATTIDGHTGITALLASGIVMGQGVHTDTLRNIEEIVGSAYDDLFDARGFGTTFDGNVGNLGTYNSFRPGAGNDVLIGNGNSRIDYSDAQDCGLAVDLLAGVVNGGFLVGTDTFSGVNRVRGSMSGDELYGGTGAAFEKFEGMGGADVIDGRGGFDIAGYAFDGNISTGIQVNMAAGTVAGDPLRTGTDTLRSIESIDGSILADVYNAIGFSSGSANAGSFGTLNEFQGRGGDDLVVGNGNTRVSYADATGAVAVDLQAGTGSGNASVGTDTFQGGVTRVRGSEFDDDIRGDSANNVLEGQSGNDTLEGRAGADTLIGGAGDDTLIGGSGNDLLTGGNGADTFVFGPGGGLDRITDFRSGEGDRLDIRDLLIGFDPGQLSSFVGLSRSNGSTTVSVDRDGAELLYGFQSIVTLDQLLVTSLNELNLVTG